MIDIFFTIQIFIFYHKLLLNSFILHDTPGGKRPPDGNNIELSQNCKYLLIRI